MKLGLGLYRHMLTPENFRFARQAGATHIVAHLVDYFQQGPRIPGTDGSTNWGVSDNRGKLWTLDELRGLKNAINEEGLELAAIENLDPPRSCGSSARHQRSVTALSPPYHWR